MDKQKKIEEMARDICNRYSEVTERCRIDNYGCNYNCSYYYKAKTLYDLGYRKIHENAVVLTREELNEKYVLIDTLVQTKEELEFIKRRYDDTNEKISSEIADYVAKARKETAENFTERVKMAFYYEFDELIPSIMADKIDEICKELGGE